LLNTDFVILWTAWNNKASVSPSVSKPSVSISAHESAEGYLLKHWLWSVQNTSLYEISPHSRLVRVSSERDTWTNRWHTSSMYRSSRAENKKSRHGWLASVTSSNR